jgi:hypothetical protein
MKQIRFKLAHLLILMTVVAVSITSVTAYREYQHRKRIKRLNDIFRDLKAFEDEGITDIRKAVELVDEWNALRDAEPNYKMPKL